MEFSIVKTSDKDEILFNTHVLMYFSLNQLIILRNELNERIKAMVDLNEKKKNF